VARYRDRHSVAGCKSDHGDAVVLANILRTDLHAHRPLPAGSELAQAIAVLARAQQDAVWDRVAAHNKLRSHLREYYPGFLAAFAAAKGGITRPGARAILARAVSASSKPTAPPRLLPGRCPGRSLRELVIGHLRLSLAATGSSTLAWIRGSLESRASGPRL
jgi:hypothetical protein